MAVEKRVRFQSAWLPWVLIAPQMAVVLVFFFCLEQFVEAFDRDLELGAAGFGGGEVPLQEVAHGY